MMVPQQSRKSPVVHVGVDSDDQVLQKPSASDDGVAMVAISEGTTRTRRFHHRHHWSNTTVLLLFWSAVALIGGCIALFFAIQKPATEPTPSPSSNGLASAADSLENSRTASQRNLSRTGTSKQDGSTKPIPLTLNPELQNSQRRQTNDGNPLECDLAVQPRNLVDRCVFAHLQQLDIPPAKLSSDEAFLRRVYIDVIGTLPTIDETESFLDDYDPEKRSKLVEQLLDRPEFPDYWAMKWCDVLRVKSEFPINLWPNAAQAYHRWVRTSIKNDMPYDQFARELLTSSGSNFRTPQVNFYRALQSQEPRAIASAVALTFLGERTDKWDQERLDGMSVFFSQVGYKPTGEWKEEIVYFRRYDESSDIETKTRPAGQATQSSELVGTLPSGAPLPIPQGIDPRSVFADWLVDKRNPWFARVVVNRVWHWLMGRGIVEPPDDVRRDNPPSNPQLLDGLADELIAADYDLKQVYRLILNSSTYQLSCIPASDDAQAYESFAAYAPRRLDAEVLIDAICRLTDTGETYSTITPEPFTFLPEKSRAISIPDGSITSSFLEMFGRPSRDTGMVSERNNRLTAGQALHLLNSNHLLRKLKYGPGLKDVLRQSISTTDAAERLYLTILSRPPTQQELTIAVNAYDSKDEMRDLAWALMNSDEFLFQH